MWSFFLHCIHRPIYPIIQSYNIEWNIWSLTLSVSEMRKRCSFSRVGSFRMLFLVRLSCHASSSGYLVMECNIIPVPLSYITAKAKWSGVSPDRNDTLSIRTKFSYLQWPHLVSALVSRKFTVSARVRITRGILISSETSLIHFRWGLTPPVIHFSEWIEYST